MARGQDGLQMSHEALVLSLAGACVLIVLWLGALGFELLSLMHGRAGAGPAVVGDVASAWALGCLVWVVGAVAWRRRQRRFTRSVFVRCVDARMIGMIAAPVLALTVASAPALYESLVFAPIQADVLTTRCAVQDDAEACAELVWLERESTPVASPGRCAAVQARARASRPLIRTSELTDLSDQRVLCGAVRAVCGVAPECVGVADPDRDVMVRRALF